MAKARDWYVIGCITAMVAICGALLFTESELRKEAPAIYALLVVAEFLFASVDVACLLCPASGNGTKTGIDSDVKSMLMQKHPYMEINYKTFASLFKASPDRFAFWALKPSSYPTKNDSLAAVAKREFQRLDPRFYYNRDFTSHIPTDIVQSKEWKAALEQSLRYPHRPILVSFGGDLPQKFNSDCIGDIPQDTTLLFFSNIRDLNKAYKDLIMYVQGVSRKRFRLDEKKKELSRRELENSIKGSDNMLRDIIAVRKEAEEQLQDCQGQMLKLIQAEPEIKSTHP